MGVKSNGTKEVKREKVLVPKSMTTREVMDKYGLKMGAAYQQEKRDFS